MKRTFRNWNTSYWERGCYYAPVVLIALAVLLMSVTQGFAEDSGNIIGQSVTEQSKDKGSPLEAPIQTDGFEGDSKDASGDVIRPVDISQNPRFLSLRSASVNMRSGPGTRYPIVWEYRRRGLPVMVVAEFENWRKIEDITGEQGWAHVSLLSRAKGVIVTESVRTLYAKPDVTADAVANVEPGVVGSLDACENNWCRVTMGGLKGWMQANALWGL